MNYNAQSFGGNNQAQNVQKQEPQAPLQWVTPNTDGNLSPTEPAPAAAVTAGRAMSPANKAQNLPVLTSMGTIPFAPRPNPGANDANAVAESTQQVAGSGGTKDKAGAVDIWEVPETPDR